MTRDQFIEYYMDGHGVDPLFRTADGHKEPDRGSRFVQKCNCGEPECYGWTMEYADDEPGYLAVLAQVKIRCRSERHSG